MTFTWHLHYNLHYIYITFTLHLQYIYNTFTLHLHYIYITFTLHLHDIYMTFTWHLHDIYMTFTLHLHYICITFALQLHYSYITYIIINYIMIQHPNIQTRTWIWFSPGVPSKVKTSKDRRINENNFKQFPRHHMHLQHSTTISAII